jgi:hypothetical protein
MNLLWKGDRAFGGCLFGCADFLASLRDRWCVFGGGTSVPGLATCGGGEVHPGVFWWQRTVSMVITVVKLKADVVFITAVLCV